MKSFYLCNNLNMLCVIKYCILALDPGLLVVTGKKACMW